MADRGEARTYTAPGAVVPSSYTHVPAPSHSLGVAVATPVPADTTGGSQGLPPVASRSAVRMLTLYLRAVET